MGFSLSLFILVWVLFIIFIPIVANDLLTTVLKAAIILIAGFLPAIIFGYFQSRRQILFIEYQQNLRRLGFAENAKVYRNKFNAIYGNSDMADRRDVVFQTPIIIATILSVIGWVTVYYTPTRDAATLIPNATTLSYGFLGAYVFALGSLVRQYVTDDLQQRYYASVVYRYLAVFVLAGLLDILFTSAPSGTILTAAFAIGFFPSMGIRVITRLGTRALNSLVDSDLEGIEDETPLNHLQGPNAYHRDRLVLEGIDNIQNLACADIVDLMLKTRFPVEQLVDWMDQALLYLHTGAKHFPSFLEKGVRTATDFIDLYDQLKPTVQENQASVGLLDPGTNLTIGQLNAIAVALRNDPNMFHIRYWRDHQFELLSEDVVLGKEANLKIMQGYPEEATVLYDRLLQQFPNYYTGYFYRGMAHTAARNYNRASDDFRTSLALATQDWENARLAYLQLGKIHQELKEFNEALEAYQQAIKLYDPFPEANLNFALLQMKMKDFEAAINNLNIAIEHKFRLGDAYANLGLAELEAWSQAGSSSDRREEVFSEVRRHFERAIEENPKLLNTYLDLAQILEQQGLNDLAMEKYSDLIARPESKDNPKASYLARLRRGNLLFNSGQYQSAIVDYDEALELERDESGFFNQGQAYLRTGQTELALGALRETVRLNMNHLPAYQQLGDLALQLNHYTEAAEAYTRVLKLQQEDDNLEGQMNAHLNLGRAYRMLGNRKQEALRELKAAADLAGKLANDLVFTAASYEMGLVLFKREPVIQTIEEQIEEAAVKFTTSAELFDVLNQPRQSVEAGLYLARALQVQGKTGEALQALEDAQTRLSKVFDRNQPEDNRLQTEINTLSQLIKTNQ
jgi:tetratricopeptide (TPR) repeat protein